MFDSDDMFYTTPVKSQHLTPEAKGPLYIPALAQGQILYLVPTEGKDTEKSRKTVIVTNWTASAIAKYDIKYLSRAGFAVYAAVNDELISLNPLISDPLKLRKILEQVRPQKPEHSYKMALDILKKGRQEVLLFDCLGLKFPERLPNYLCVKEMDRRGVSVEEASASTEVEGGVKLLFSGFDQIQDHIDKLPPDTHWGLTIDESMDESEWQETDESDEPYEDTIIDEIIALSQLKDIDYINIDSYFDDKKIGELLLKCMPQLCRLTIAEDIEDGKIPPELFAQAHKLKHVQICSQLWEDFNVSATSINLPQLQTLALEENNLSTAKLVMLLSATASTLERLSLSGSSNLEELVGTLDAFPVLKTFSLASEGYSDSTEAEIALIIELLKHTPKLEDLDLDICLSVSQLSQIQQVFPKLKALSIYPKIESGDIFSDLNLACLEKLEIRLGNTEERMAINQLLKATVKLKKLTILSYSLLELNEAYFADLDLSSLEELDLSRTRVNIRFLQRLCEVAPNLKKLYIAKEYELVSSKSGIDFPMLEAVSLAYVYADRAFVNEMLTSMPNLKKLDLFDCHMHDLADVIDGVDLEIIKTPKRDQVYFEEYHDESKDEDDEDEDEDEELSDQIISSNLANSRLNLNTDQSEKVLGFTNYLFNENEEGEKKPIDPRDYRLNICSGLKPSADNTYIELIPPRYDESSVVILNSVPVSSDLLSIMGSCLVLLNADWLPIPSRSAHEELLFLNAMTPQNVSLRDKIEVAHCTLTNQYLVRLKAPAGAPIKADLHFGLSDVSESEPEFPKFIVDLMDKYRKFGAANIDFSAAHTSQEMLAAIQSQRTGACRYRAIGFLSEFAAEKIKGNPELAKWEVHIINNDVHSFVELKYDSGQGCRVDLGGIAGELKEKKNIALDTLPASHSGPLIEPRKPLTATWEWADLFNPGFKSAYPISAQTYIRCKTPIVLNQLAVLWQGKTASDEQVYFINEPWQLGNLAADAFSVVVNIYGWSARDRARLNSLLDQSIEKKSPRVIVLGVQHTYGKDFESRIGDSHYVLSGKQAETVQSKAAKALGEIAADPIRILAKEANQDVILFAPIKETAMEVEGGHNAVTVDFFKRDSDWPGRLFGKPMLDSTGKLSWDSSSSSFMALLKSNHGECKLNFKNPPEDPNFWRWLQVCWLRKKIEYPGLESFAWPDHLSVRIQQGYNFNCDASLFIAKNRGAGAASSAMPIEPAATFLLNRHTMPHFFGIVGDASGRMTFADGWLAIHSGQALRVIVTESLTVDDWMQFLNAAEAYKVTLELECFTKVRIPTQVNEIANFSITEHGAKVNLPVTNTADLLAAALRVPIAAIGLSDLTGQWQKNATGELVFEKSMLAKQLTTPGGPPVIFYGDLKTLSPELMTQLLPTTEKKWMINGNILDLEVKVFFEEKIPLLTADIKTAPLSLLPKEACDAKRASDVLTVLNSYPWVVIQGQSGVGKTHFVFNTLLPNLRSATGEKAKGFVGIDTIAAWASDKTAGPKVLVLDEANMDTPLSWMIGLYEKPQRVFWQGQCYELSADHVVVLMGNAHAYGGERVRQPLLEHAACKVTFDPYTFEDIYQYSLKPLLSTRNVPLDQHEIIKAIFLQIDTAIHPSCITARELQMMVLLMSMMKSNTPAATWEKSAKCAGLMIAEQCVPHAQRQQFQKLSNDLYFDALKISFLSQEPLPESKTFKFVEEHRPTMEALKHILGIHQWRNQPRESIHAGGLGLCAAVLEGPAGIGKSAFVEAYLASQGYLEAKEDAMGLGIGAGAAAAKSERYYIKIPTDASITQKEKLLRWGFSKGYVVIMDESNCGVMLEKLRNELLDSMAGSVSSSGHFGLLIGTQNPAHFDGRCVETSATAHRQWKIPFAPRYSQQSKRSIARHAYPELRDVGFCGRVSNLRGLLKVAKTEFDLEIVTDRDIDAFVAAMPANLGVDAEVAMKEFKAELEEEKNAHFAVAAVVAAPAPVVVQVGAPVVGLNAFHAGFFGMRGLPSPSADLSHQLCKRHNPYNAENYRQKRPRGEEEDVDQYFSV